MNIGVISLDQFKEKCENGTKRRNVKTELKCKGCKKDIPKERLDKESCPTWFGIYQGCELLQWVCVGCWKKGIRHEKIKR